MANFPFHVQNLRHISQIDKIINESFLLKPWGGESFPDPVEDLFARIGKNIRKYRKARGMTQEQLAEAAELSAYFVGSIERGQATVSVRSLDQVARALRVSLKDLFAFTEELSREELLKEVLEYVRSASSEELRAVLTVCRLMRRPNQARV